MAADPAVLRDVDVIFGGWGLSPVDDAFVAAAPNLKAVFYAAGSIAYWAKPAARARGIRVTTANTANARPVAEYTVGVVLLALKRFWPRARDLHDRRPPSDLGEVGNYRSTIGLISMGAVARVVVDLLRPHGMTVLA